MLLLIVAMISLVVGGIGIMNIMLVSVTERTKEIGVRMAVGAQRKQVVWMVLRDSLILTAIGAMIGVPLALLTGRALASALYDVKPNDLTSVVFALIGITLVSVGASLIPARRAAAIDPLSALRSE